MPDEPMCRIVEFAPSCKRRHTEDVRESIFHSPAANQEPDDDDSYDCCPGCRSLRQEQLEERIPVLSETATSRASFPLIQQMPRRAAPWRALRSWLQQLRRAAMFDTDDPETWIALAIIGGLLVVLWPVLRAAAG
jgi:hypothetical protein